MTFVKPRLLLSNVPPTLDPLSDLAIDEDAVQQVIGLNGISDGEISDGDNLLFNGDFELGNVGFETEYIHHSTEGDSRFYPLDYEIVTNPSPYNGEFASFGDKTTGTGLMMLVDSGWNLSELVWGQTVDVQSNATYDFSGWLASAVVNNYNESYLQVEINGELIGSVYSPSTAGLWSYFQFSWDSLNASTAAIEIYERGSIGFPDSPEGGHDFTLDDLSFERLSGSQPLRVTATSDNAGLIPDPVVTYNSPDSTGNSILYSSCGSEWNGHHHGDGRRYCTYRHICINRQLQYRPYRVATWTSVTSMVMANSMPSYPMLTVTTLLS